MNRPGPGPQPLRTIPGSMFQAQQNSAARGAPLGSGRLQNGKIGTGSSWGFGVPMNGAPGLSSTQARTNAGAISSFAQTIGGSQSNTPLDLSEFPSLSGTPQLQQQNISSQAIWSNPSLRVAQHTPVQRPQGPNTPAQTQSAQQAAQQNQAQSSQTHEDGASAGQSQFPGGGDDYRYGGQSGVGPLSGPSQPQTGNIEEFPPLGGGGGGELGPDRRAGMIQNAAYGGNTNGAFAGLGQSRSGLASPQENQQSAAGSGVSRSQLETMRSSSAALQEAERTGNQRTAQANFTGAQSTQLPFRGPQQQQPIGSRTQPSPLDQNYPGSDMVGSPNAQQPPRHKRLSEMTDMERFGLPGLLTMIPPESPDHSSLAIGQDLTALGLDLNRPDNSPLYPTFGSPFVEASSRPVIPDFTLPAAYTVTNVPPLHSKMSSFSAETLLAIFYQYPRDILQELAASELYSRDWRWHKVLRQWMMKDPELPPPVPVTSKVERGWYLFFDVNNWRRERREFELHYEHLDQRHGPHAAAAL